MLLTEIVALLLTEWRRTFSCVHNISNRSRLCSATSTSQCRHSEHESAELSSVGGAHPACRASTSICSDSIDRNLESSPNSFTRPCSTLLVGSPHCLQAASVVCKQPVLFAAASIVGKQASHCSRQFYLQAETIISNNDQREAVSIVCTAYQTVQSVRQLHFAFDFHFLLSPSRRIYHSTKQLTLVSPLPAAH